MPSYTYKFQRANFASDKFQDKGVIDKSKAISAFKLFPWDEPSTGNPEEEEIQVPKMIFNSDDERQLIIYAMSLEDSTFAIEYGNFKANAYANFVITSQSKEDGWTVQTMIEFYFDNSLEAQVEMSQSLPPQIQALQGDLAKVEKRSKRPEVVLDFRPRHFRIMGFGTFFWMGISIVLIYMEMPIGLHVFVALIGWIPTLVLHFTYYLNDQGVEVIINPGKEVLTYRKEGNEIKFGLSDIDRCRVIMPIVTRKTRTSWSNYSYVWFTLKNGNSITITCLLGRPEVIVEALNCKFEVKKKLLQLLPMK